MDRINRSPATVLVLGANGKTGRRIADRLSRLGYPVRKGSRTGVPPFIWEKSSTWEAALEGAELVYLNHPDFVGPGAAEQIERFASLAAANDVRRIVMLSSRALKAAAVSEHGVKKSGVEWVIVRPGWFYQNFSEDFFLDGVRAREIAWPEGNYKDAFVDADDIADVVVAALTNDRHVGKLYELSGPRVLSFPDLAADLSQAIGEEVAYIPLTQGRFRASLESHGMSGEYTDDLLESMDGEKADLAGGVEEVLGRLPKDFSEYARETAATGVWDA
ncbi:NAD(P)H-binding protein [Amycolatopsis sp. TRM77291]